MKILSYTRVLSEKTISLLRSINSSSTAASVFGMQQRAQHSEEVKGKHTDEPIEMTNPFERERKICILCKHNIEPNYKNVRLLSQFQSRFTGRTYGRHITGLCKSKHEKLVAETTKAQHAGLMAYYNKHIMYVNDPKLYDLDNPFKPHKY